MEFVNHTPFPALAFEGVDTRGQAFHVVALRQTFTWGASGELAFAEEQAPLCDADEYFDDSPEGEPRQESDLCHYKPRCDVIVNATAHAPLAPPGKPVHRFDVRLVLRQPDSLAPLPEPPQPLNPLMPIGADAMARWRTAVAHARANPLPGQRLIDKVLSVGGKRRFNRREGAAHLADSMLKLGSLGVVRPAAWQLTEPEALDSIALRLKHAFGGQCRIEAGSQAAARVANKHRLSPEQAASHPDPGAAPTAHDAFAANPAGCGFSRDWYLDATGTNSVTAPQVEHPDRPIALRHFDQARTGGLNDGEPLVAGLGIRPKGHPQRARLVGSVDQGLVRGDTALPAGFDFAVWNAAWLDQQVDALRGNELIELCNLCSPATPAAKRDAKGNTQLSLALPGHLCFVLVRYDNGAIGELAARLDTLLIEPEQRRIACVWRATVAQQPAVRALEARMILHGKLDPVRGAAHG